MNFLDALHQLLGAHAQAPAPGQPHQQHPQFAAGQQQQNQPPQRASAGRVWEDGSGVNLGHINPYQSGHGIPLTKQMGGMTFANRPGRQWEDESLNNGSQGLVPINRDIANLRGGLPQQGFGQQVQNVGGVLPQVQGQAPNSWQHLGTPGNMVNPQLRDNGYFWNQ